MKKLLLTLIAALCVTVGFAENVVITLDDTGKSSDGSKLTPEASYCFKVNGVDGKTNEIATFTAATNVYQGKSEYGWKLGTGKQTGSLTFTLATAVDAKKIVVSAAMFNSNESDVKINDNNVGAVTSGFKDYKLAVNGSVTEITVASSSKQIYVKSITIVCDEEVEKTETNLTFSETSVTYDLSSEEPFVAPTLTVTPADLTGVTYTSSNEAVATVDANTGAVSIVGKGTTTIKATFVETDTHLGSSASYTLKVTAPAVPGEFDFVGWDFPGADSGWNSSYAEHVVEYSDAIVTFASANKQSGTITDCPVTKGQDVTVVLKDMTKDITSFSAEFAKWTTNDQTITVNTSADGETFNATDITTTEFAFAETSLPAGVKAIRFSFSQAKQVGIKKITITTADAAPAVEEPEFTTDSKIGAISEKDEDGYTNYGGEQGSIIAVYADHVVIKNFINSGRDLRCEYTGNDISSVSLVAVESDEAGVRALAPAKPVEDIVAEFNGGTITGDSEGGTITLNFDKNPDDKGYYFAAWGDDIATAINGVSAANGKAVYNLNGQRVNAANGLYIVGGQKVVVK